MNLNERNGIKNIHFFTNEECEIYALSLKIFHGISNREGICLQTLFLLFKCSER